jgi:hypothetical protein
VAREIVLSRDTAWFDERVRAYYDEHWKGRDRPLPPR